MTAPEKTPAIRNPVSLVGALLTTASAVLFLAVFVADLFGLHIHPYVGAVFFLILPALFILGLLLMPFGAWLERRRRARGLETRWPIWNLNDPRQRTIAVIVFALTLANLAIVSMAAYRGVEYMDSVQFCGQVCHTVMQPEFVAYQNAPHSRVACVECHVGSGAGAFAQAKIAGTRQLISITLNTYSRPIPPAVDVMRPARDTCEHCHWPGKYHGDLNKTRYEYSDDEQNSETVTKMQVHVGGGSDEFGPRQGIHWHMNISNEVEYISTDDKRQVISYVRVKDRSGNVREYYAEGVTPEQVANGERHRMDCMDCHNRPAHTMTATPEKAIDALIAAGEIPKSLPFVRREAVKAVKASYPSQDAAAEGISRSLRDFYQSSYKQAAASQAAEIDKAVLGAQTAYRRNVFPPMNVTFGTYPNNIGHMDFPGCFRCHDDSHSTKDGKKIGQDCETCHHME